MSDQQPPDDSELVAATLAGRREAFSPLLARYYPSLLRLCQRLLGMDGEAQDVAQEAAIQSFLGLARLHDPGRFGAWLHAIAANLARSAMRRRRALSLEVVGETAFRDLLWANGPLAPDKVAAMREVHDTIVAALGELSAVNREAVIGFYLDGYSYDELAALLGVPVSTVKGRLFKGRSQLRQSLAPLAADTLSLSQPPARGAPMPSLIPLRLHSIYTETWGHRMALLRGPDEPERVLPIWIDPLSAEAIQMAVHGEQLVRPSTHDLTLRLVDLLDGQIEQVVIKKVADEIYYAELHFARGEQRFSVDTRSSDGLPLALRAGAPIMIERELFGRDSLLTDEFMRLHGEEPAIIDKVRHYSIANMRSISLVELADLEPETEPIVWRGTPLTAVALPDSLHAMNIWMRLPEPGTPIWMLMNSATWQDLARRAAVRRAMMAGKPQEKTQ